jgi:adenine-specific DNA-methyltransferase
MDTSRVPLALARQRLLTATYPWYTLKDPSRGPAGGFVYARKQNKRGEEVGGLVPHITLKSIANDEPPTMEVLVDRPEEEKKITRVAGPFVVEATIPTPVDWEGDGDSDSGSAPMEAHGNFVDRMLEVLRRSPSINTQDNRQVTFEQVRPPAKALVLNAEALLKGTGDAVAFVFGPEHGAVSERLVDQAMKEANRKNYTRLFVIGFAIEANARLLVEQSADIGIPATYVQATPDLVMGSLLKTTRASQVFSVPACRMWRSRPSRPPSPAATRGGRCGWWGSTPSTPRRWRRTIPRAPTCPAGCWTATTTAGCSGRRRCSSREPGPGRRCRRRSRPSSRRGCSTTWRGIPARRSSPGSSGRWR